MLPHLWLSAAGHKNRATLGSPSHAPPSFSAQVDLDGSGGISFDEFVMMMRLGDMETDFEKEIKDAFAFFDKNKDGQVLQ